MTCVQFDVSNMRFVKYDNIRATSHGFTRPIPLSVGSWMGELTSASHSHCQFFCREHHYPVPSTNFLCPFKITGLVGQATLMERPLQAMFPCSHIKTCPKKHLLVFERFNYFLQILAVKSVPIRLNGSLLLKFSRFCQKC